ncbi:MAG: hypothetical protein MJZ37_04695, partial [Bacilli bacterium]|nr:hypothetical protein [Bacilli bacterium]
MRYEKYEKSVKRAAKTLSAVFKFRVPIIATLGVATATTVGLVSTKGLVGDVSISANEIFYGETIKLEGSSFLSGDVETEYRPLNASDDSWTTEAPYFVGDYEARLRSENNFGSYYYSDPVKYTIKPLNLDLNIRSAQRVTYGDDPLLDTVSLVGYDKLDKYDFVYEDISAKKTNVKVDLDKVAIVNERGEDVTKCYNFTTEDKELEFLPKKLTLDFPGASRDYDGTPLKNDNYTLVGELAYEDRFSEESFVSPSITDIGQISNEREIKILNKDDVDVTSQYSITKNFNSLIVNKIQIKLTSESIDKVYNGEPFEASEFAYDRVGKLLPGDELIVEFDDLKKPEKSSRQIDACKNVDNSFTYKIINSKGVDVTDDYYDVTAVYGKMNISKRPLDISYTNVKVYDRLTLKDTYPIDDPTQPIYKIVNNCSLADPSKEVIEIQYKTDENGVSYGDYIDAGLEENGLLIFNIFSDSTKTESVLRNYEISFDSDLFAIGKQTLTISLKNQEKWYDGTKDYKKDSSAYSVIGIVDGDVYELNYNELDSANSGTHTISLNKTKPITIKDPARGELEVNNDYDIRLINDGEATLRIKAPKIDVDFLTAENTAVGSNYFSFKYDGTVHSLSNLFSAQKYDFETDDRSVSTAEAGWMDLDIPNSSTLGINDILADGDYVMIDPDSDMTSDKASETKYQITPDFRVIHYDDITGIESDVTDNYNRVDHTYEFDVKYRNVTFAFNESEYNFKYDGLSHDVYTSFSDASKPYDESLIDLNDGDYISIERCEVVKDVLDSGTYTFDVIICNSADEDVTGNYNVSGKTITYTITPLKVDIELNEDEFTFTYDAQQHCFDEIYNPDDAVEDQRFVMSSDTEILPGHTVYFVSETKPTNAGTYEVDYKIVIEDDSGEEVTGNYSIVDYQYTYFINKREIDIDLDSSYFEVLYDAQVHSLQGIYDATYNKTLVNVAPGSGHTIKFVEADAPMINADTYKDINYDIHVFDGSTDITNNYDVETYKNDYTLKINKRNIDIKFYKSDSLEAGKFVYVYNGNSFTLQDLYENGSYTVESEFDLLSIHTLSFDGGFVYGWTNGEKDLDYSIKITDNATSADVIDNYEITKYVYKVNVLKKTLDIKFNTSEFEFVYDGEEHNIELSRQNGAYVVTAGVTSEDAFEMINYSTVKNATLDSSGNVTQVNAPFNFYIYNIVTNEEVTDNYDIVSYTYNYEISPFEISGHYLNSHVGSVDEVGHKISFTYDGGVRTMEDYVFTSSQGTNGDLDLLLQGLDSLDSLDFGFFKGTTEKEFIKNVEDTGYQLVARNPRIVCGLEDVTSCYSFSFSEYTFEVSKRDLRFDVDYAYFANWKYTNHLTDAVELFSNGTISQYNPLADGDTLEVSGYEKMYYGVETTPLVMTINSDIDGYSSLNNYLIVDQNGDPFVAPAYVDNKVSLNVYFNTDDSDFNVVYKGTEYSLQNIYDESYLTGKITTDLSVSGVYGYFDCETFTTVCSETEELFFVVMDSYSNNVTFNFDITYFDRLSNEITDVDWVISPREIKVSIPYLSSLGVDADGITSVPYDGVTYSYGVTSPTSKTRYVITDLSGATNVISNLYNEGASSYDYILIGQDKYDVASLISKYRLVTVKDVADGVVTLAVDTSNVSIKSYRGGFVTDVSDCYELVIETYNVKIVPVNVDIQFKTVGHNAFNFVFDGNGHNFQELLTDTNYDYMVNQDFRSQISG